MIISQAFPKRRRLLSKRQFDAVFRRRCSVSDDLLVVYANFNTPSVASRIQPPIPARLGLVVSKKVGNAVQRNRWKRVLREAFRLGSFPTGLDLVVLPKFRIHPKLHEIGDSLAVLVPRLHRKLGGPVSSITTPDKSVPTRIEPDTHESIDS